MFKIIDFKTDYQTNPIGIDNPNPTFNWKYQAYDGFTQASYRIIVSSGIEKIKSKQGDLWDSGEVSSSSQAGIIYQGQKLKSRQTCFVMCIAKDNNNNIACSDIATFEMGLLCEEDWKGKWVSIPVNFQGSALYFRKTLDIPQKPIKRARAYICGLGCYELYMNGKKINGGVLNPAVTEYSKRVHYCVYDIKNHLIGKEDTIGIILGHGWFGSRALLAQLYIDFEDGGVWEDHTANCCGWWVTGSPIVDNSIYGGEVYDARLEEKYPDWATSNFKPGWEKGWLYTVLVSAPSGKKESQNIEPIEVIEIVDNVRSKKIDENTFLYDVGKNIAGWASVTVKGDKGSKITIIYGEDIDKSGRVNQLNLRSAKARDIYILKGGGEESYAPRFTYHGFRYAEAKIEGNAKILRFEAQRVCNAVKRIGYFHTSDEKVNKLHEMAYLTETNNLHGVMTDCPQRDERFGWLNDLVPRIYQTVNNISAEKMLVKVIRDIADTQDERGAIADTAPFYTGAKPADPVCVTLQLFVLKAYQLYGNIQIVYEQYQNCKKWVNYLLTRQQNFIVDYYYYADWVAPDCYKDTFTDGIYVSSVYLNWHLQLMAKLAEITSNEKDKQYYSSLAEKSKQALIEKYYDKKTKNFHSGSQSANAMALSIGIAPEQDKKEIAKNIADDIIARNYHCTSGNQGYRHVFYALSKYGYTDVLMKMLLNPEYPGWGYMLNCGATSVWERWEKEMQVEMHSFNHPMFASYDGWFYNCIAGIMPDDNAVGYDKVIIKPNIAYNLEYVNCSINTIRGKVTSNWSKKGDGIEYFISIPPNCTANIIIEGKTKSCKGKIEKTFQDGNKSQLYVLSGDYIILAEGKI